MSGTAAARTRLALVVTVCIGYVASQFFRSANAVIAPDLMRDLSISAESMGIVTGAFFLAFAAVQLPCGVLLDRFGPRRVMSSLLLLAAAGSVVFSLSDAPPGLAAGRALMGVGCSAGLMGAMVVFARWFPADRFSTLAAMIFAIGGLGNLVATTPLAAVSQGIGWRGAFLGMAVVTLAMAALLGTVLRDAPPGHPALHRKPESPREILAGLGQVLRNGPLWLIVAIQLIAYPALMTMLALWAGPYLSDVHGLGPVERGNVLFAMTVAQLLGTLAYGPLDRVFDTRKWLVLAGGAMTVAILAVLALVPGLALWQAAALLIAMCGVGSYQMVLHTHARAILPEHLVGRGLTLQNMAAIGGVFLLQSASGFIVGALSDGGAQSEFAYRVVFAFLAGLLAVALLIYAPIADSRPRQLTAG